MSFCRFLEGFSSHKSRNVTDLSDLRQDILSYCSDSHIKLVWSNPLYCLYCIPFLIELFVNSFKLWLLITNYPESPVYSVKYLNFGSCVASLIL